MKQKTLKFTTYDELIRCQECKNYHSDRRWCNRLSLSIGYREAQKLIKCKDYLVRKGSK